MNNVAPVIKEIADSCGIDQKNVIINDLYLQWVLQPSYEMIVLCGTLILGIVLFSVVVIYNIFQVGIAQKVQEYGKIKALGATRKQMKQLIFREGILLAVPSIPLGLLFGFLIAKVSFNWLVEQGNLVSSGIKNHQVPLFSLTIMLICIFVSFLTVVLALRKPMKIVSRISPIEATRYLDGSKTQKQGRRKGRKDVTVFSMAMANVTGNPKRTIATILTMGLSCVLFVIISNYVGNIDTEHEARIAINHGQFELQLDYSQNYDEAYSENNLDTILQNNPLNDSMIEEIKSIPGVTDVMTREIVYVNLNGTRYPADIVSKNDFDFMRQDGDIGSMDYDQAVKNGEIFFGWSTWMEQDGYAPGESIAFDFENGSGTYTYQGKIAGSFVSADTYLVIPEGVYRSMNPKGTAYGYLWVDCDKKDVASVEQSLNTLISNTSHIKMDTYHAQLQSAEFSARTMKLGCYLFMAVVGFIGFMNMANTMIMNITTKKQEYGVLQAVGMTNKQLNLCLQLQGLIFTVGTICVALVVGLPLGYALFAYAKHNGIFGMNVYHVPMTPILAMILLVSLLQIVLSCVLSSNLKKETLVERIRYQG
jgi:putative ABC transport system permease protein